jgi:hypothetical protein
MRFARRDGITALRGTVTEVEHRFFLALLLNVPEREGILRMVGQRFAEDEPIEDHPALGWGNDGNL